MSNLPSTLQQHAIKSISPPWLSTGNAEKVMFGFGLAADAILEKLNQAMRAHMPGQGDPTALPLLAADRVMAQGPTETNEHFATRLSAAFDAWQHAGSRPAVLGQVIPYVSQYWTEAPSIVPRALIVGTSASGTWATWDTFYSDQDPIADEPAHLRVGPANWDWDGDHLWWRAWLVLFFDNTSTLGPAPVWGASGRKWGDTDISWGLNVPSSVMGALRSLVKPWKSKNTFYPWIIVAFDGNGGDTGDAFSPNSATGSGNPDGTWGRWSKVVDGVRVPARDSNARYVDGTGVYEQCSVPVT